MSLASTSVSHDPLPSVMAHLRAGTRSLHARVEASVDLVGRCATLDGYRDLLVRMLGLHAPLEKALERLEWRAAGIDLEERRKARLLRTDLSVLGVSPDAASAACLPDLPTLAAGFGCLYVLEGSTLGGQIILRHVEASLGVGPASGASFFASYGPRLGIMWRAFGEAATFHCDTPERLDEALHAAVSTFEAFDTWIGKALSPPRADALPYPGPP